MHRPTASCLLSGVQTEGRLKADSKCLCSVDGVRMKSLPSMCSLCLHGVGFEQLVMSDLMEDILTGWFVFENVGEWFLARSAACLVCCRGSHQPGQQCSLWRDCSALPGGSHLACVYKPAQLDHAIQSCHSMWVLSCIDITVMTTDVVAFHVAQTRTMCVHYHVGSAVTCSEARAYRWL